MIGQTYCHRLSASLNAPFPCPTSLYISASRHIGISAVNPGMKHCIVPCGRDVASSDMSGLRMALCEMGGVGRIKMSLVTVWRLVGTVVDK